MSAVADNPARKYLQTVVGGHPDPMDRFTENLKCGPCRLVPPSPS